MSWSTVQARRWLWCALAAAAAPAVSVANAQEAEAVPAANTPDLIESPSEYPLRGVRRDVRADIIARSITVPNQAGDDFLLALAQAGGLNIICVAPRELPDVQTRPDWSVLGHLLEAGKDCDLSWLRLSERAVVMWPAPDRDEAARVWIAWWQDQTTRDEAREAVTDEEAAQTLQKLGAQDTPQVRERLREEYALMVRGRLQEQVRAAFSKYLQEHGAPNGRQSVAVRDLPPEAREAVAFLARVPWRSRWNRAAELWYSPQREAFWQQARLSVTPTQAQGPQERRWMRLEVPAAPAGEQPATGFLVGQFDPRTSNPYGTPRVHTPTPARPAGGLQLQGARMPLRQVLGEVSKQSGLSIAADLERLRDVRLTVDVQGMQAPEFLAALSRALLVKWLVEGKRATAQEASYDANSRFLLQMGNLEMFADMSRGKNQWIEHTALGHAVRAEAGQQVLAPGGLPVTGFSPEVQEGVRRQTQQQVFGNVLSVARAVLPQSVEQGTLRVGGSSSNFRVYVRTADGARKPLRQGSASINLLMPGVQAREIAPMDTANHALGIAPPATPTGGVPGVQSKADDLVQAFQNVRRKEDQAKSEHEVSLAQLNQQLGLQ